MSSVDSYFEVVVFFEREVNSCILPPLVFFYSFGLTCGVTGVVVMCFLKAV